MAKKSILSGMLDEAPEPSPRAIPDSAAATRSAAGTKPSRVSKLHVGGYFDPRDPVVTAFQKLKVDLRRSQQDMLLEALADFVAKHRAASAFARDP